MFARSSRPIATLFGIPLHVHWTALITALFIAISAPAAVSVTGGGAVVIGGLAIALFAFSLLAHEYAHALVARRRGVGVRRVQMWALGGMAELESEPRRWSDEFLIAVVGPIVSLTIGAVAGVAAFFASATSFAVPAELLAWMAVVNLALGIFNLLPGYPLDGGRVLHSLIWWQTGRRHRATTVTATTGQIIGAGLIALGVVSFFAGGSGLITAFVGWFIITAAQQAKAHAAEAERLVGVHAGEIARPLPAAVRGDLSVDEFCRAWVSSPITPGSPEVLLVVDTDQRATGLVPMSAIAAVASLHAPGVQLDALAIPATALGVVLPSSDLGDAVASSPSGFILVSEPDRLVGLITPADLRAVLDRTPKAA